jgi:hypothetical protein
MLPLAFNSHLDNNNNVGLHTFCKNSKFKITLELKGEKIHFKKCGATTILGYIFFCMW